MSETNPLVNEHPKCEGRVFWNDPCLKEITRLRLLSDPGYPYWDVSYCYGRTHAGTWVDVDLPFSHLEKNKSINKQLVEISKKNKVYAKGLGLFNAISCLV